MDVNWLSRPFTSTRRDMPIGRDEAGNPIYRTGAGHTYAAKPAMNDETLARLRAVEDFDRTVAGGGFPAPENRQADIGDPLSMFFDEAVDMVTTPRRAYEGEPLTYGDVGEFALEFGLAGAPMPAPKGATRIFAGRNAKTADMDALSRAEDLAKSGASRDDIWRDTGWFQGVDGNWRFEIDDSGARFEPRPSGRRSGGYGEVIDHPDLLKAYPDLANVDAQAEVSRAYRDVGGYTPYENREHLGLLDLQEDIFARGPNVDGVRSTLLHEGQHAVQHREGFPIGGNQSVGRELSQEPVLGEIQGLQDYIASARRNLQSSSDLNSPFERELAESIASAEAELAALQGRVAGRPKTAFDAYRSIAGEVEARNVETRRDFTPEQRRATPPWTTQDVPDADQIVRFGSGPQASVNPAQAQAQEVLDLLKAGRGDEVTDDMLAAADDLYLFENYDLPMDEASRMARAREMGFDTDTPLYHGTTAPEDFSQLNPSQRGKIGPGVYMTPNEKRASVFAGSDQASILASEPPLTNARVMPLVGTNRPADDAARMAARGARDNYEGDHLAAYRDIFDARGFDGVLVSDERTILDPRNIRSRFARFDPRLSHLRNLSAGVAGGGVVLSEAERKQEIKNYLRSK